MAKDEMIDLGSILVQSDLEVLTIKKLNIVEAANEHGRMELVFLSGKSISPGDCSRYQDSPVQVRTGEGDIIFCGLCQSVGLKSLNSYTEVYLTACTYSIQADREKKDATFQSETKTLQQVLDQGMGNHGLVAVDEEMTISEMLSQEQETDWVFGRRIANQYGKQLFVNSKTGGKAGGPYGHGWHQYLCL